MKQLALITLSLLTIACAASLQANQNTARAAFTSYVALGDSLTAGYQSGGLRADGQQGAYPVLLAKLAGVPFGAPLTRNPGCPPPMGARASQTSCQRLNPSVTVTNFAVPGARVEDLISRNAANVSSSARPLYNLILGPQDTQVSAALKAQPKFISVWIGSNNALGAALSGQPGEATTPEQFERAYDELLRALRPANANVVLLTVPDVTQVPALVPGPKLTALGVSDESCRSSQNRVSITRLLSGQLPVSCDASYALTPAETRALQQTVRAYNDVIAKLAGRHGAKVFPVAGLQTPVTASYDPGSSMPFGQDYSLDGVHPSSLAHERLARSFAEFLNREYGTDIPASGTLSLGDE